MAPLSVWWCSAVRGHVASRRPEVAKQLERIFAFIPSDQRLGPWSWLPLLAIFAFAALALATRPLAMESYSPSAEAEELRTFRLAAFGFGLSVLGWLWQKQGCWVMMTWTVLGWTVTTIRYFAGAVGLRHLQRVLTFPSLLANIVTVLVWYLCIVPGIVALAPKAGRRQALEHTVFSLLLFTVHGVNLPFSLADFYMQPVRLELFDLWAGFSYGLSYLVFYLVALDAMGLHLYFILTPRKWWSAFVYSGILALTAAFWSGLNAWAQRLSVP